MLRWRGTDTPAAPLPVYSSPSRSSVVGQVPTGIASVWCRLPRDGSEGAAVWLAAPTGPPPLPTRPPAKAAALRSPACRPGRPGIPTARSTSSRPAPAAAERPSEALEAIYWRELRGATFGLVRFSRDAVRVLGLWPTLLRFGPLTDGARPIVGGIFARRPHGVIRWWAADGLRYSLVGERGSRRSFAGRSGAASRGFTTSSAAAISRARAAGAAEGADGCRRGDRNDRATARRCARRRGSRRRGRVSPASQAR